MLILVAMGSVWGGWATWRFWQSPGTGSLPDVAAAPPPTVVSTDWLEDPPLTRDRFEQARSQAAEIDPSAGSRLVEWRGGGGVDFGSAFASGPKGDSKRDRLRFEYSLDEQLTEQVFEILRRGRVHRGHAIVLDPRSGRLLAYVSTDSEGLSPARAYPAASIVKILTAAALLEDSPTPSDRQCVYRGNKYRLNRRRLERPKRGTASSLEKALATSNNQCFSQWAVHDLGEQKLLSIFERFGWLRSPAPGHDAGYVEAVESKLDLGRLGSGLDGVRVTPLHVATVASVLYDGRWREPWWVDRVVDSQGHSLALPKRQPARRVLPEATARSLRKMLVATTKRGTAKRAFRTRQGRPLLGTIEVAGKTGNLTGSDPFGRYEWFLGIAPADEPKVAVVVLQLQSNLWWSRSSELAAKVLQAVFCDRKRCRAENADRWTGDLGDWVAPILMSDLERPAVLAKGE